MGGRGLLSPATFLMKICMVSSGSGVVEGRREWVEETELMLLEREAMVGGCGGSEGEGEEDGGRVERSRLFSSGC